MGKALTKDLVQAIAAKKNMTLKEAEEYVDAFFSVVSEGLHREGVVKIKGFGTFKLIDVRDRESVDVNTGERMTIEGHTKMTFTPEATLRDMVNKPFSQFETVVVNDGVDLETLVSVENNESTEAELSENAEFTENGDISDKANGVEENEEFTVPSEKVNAPNIEPTEAEQSDREQQPEPVATLEEAYEEPVIDTGDKIADIQPFNKGTEETAPIEIPVAAEKTEISDNTEQETSVGLGENRIDSDGQRCESNGQRNEANEQRCESNDSEDNRLTDTDTLSEEPVNEEVDNSSEQDCIKSMQSRKTRNGIAVKILIAFVAVLVVVAGFFAGYLYAESKLQDKADKDNVAAAHQKGVSTKNNTGKHHRVTEQAKASQKESLANSADASIHQGQEFDDANTAAQADGKVVDAKKASEDALHAKNDMKNGQDAKLPAKDSKEENVKRASSDKKLAVAMRYIETGAYRIVGTERTYKVKSGETMGSIARRFLGDGMDCYIQVCNGKSDVAEGDMLKIPKLELKSKKK